MRKRIAFLFLLLFACNLLLFSETIVSTDPIVGLWKSMGSNRKATGLWKFYLEDGKIYGVCIAAFKKPIDVRLVDCKSSYSEHPVKANFNQQLMRTTPLIYNLKRKDAGSWVDGYIIDSRSGNRWNFDMQIHFPDGKKYKVKTLQIRGGWGCLKKSQYWEPATKAEANKLILAVIKKYGSDKARANPDAFLEK